MNNRRTNETAGFITIYLAFSSLYTNVLFGVPIFKVRTCLYMYVYYRYIYIGTDARSICPEVSLYLEASSAEFQLIMVPRLPPPCFQPPHLESHLTNNSFSELAILFILPGIQVNATFY